MPNDTSEMLEELKRAQKQRKSKNLEEYENSLYDDQQDTE